MKTLLCPLDWGLGHASRSLALAERLSAAGDEIVWASSGQAAAFLKRELGAGTQVYPLPGYRVQYPSRSMVYNVLRQLPRWAATVRAERPVIERLVKEHRPDRIISDSRFGCYHPEVNSIFLTHQLHPITHFSPASWVYRRQLGHFAEFWVPDQAGPDRLSGRLSDPRGYERVKFIGPLSRLLAPPATPPEYDYLLLLSGPEPARTHLENQLLNTLRDRPASIALVRGLPKGGPALKTTLPDNLTSYDFADRHLLAALISQARTLICRSGYSTLMDLATFAGRLILIPTPGQTEQLYLARRMQLLGRATYLKQVDVASLATTG